MVYDLGLKYWVDTHLKHTFLKIELYECINSNTCNGKMENTRTL